MTVRPKQLVFFSERTEVDELQDEVTELKISLGKIRRGLFRRTTEMKKELDALKLQMDEKNAIKPTVSRITYDFFRDNEDSFFQPMLRKEL